ncbi:MAG: AAA family ATPase, partial [Mycobacterium sp.]|nr:AAA family ATPase [Mycobacterium sp.]
MILHRLRLTNFRGVADREITLPTQGVVVVCGPNEIGKSSMLEALDLLLTYRDRSTHRDVKAVKPANADVGSQVEAEITTGPYRFVYRKRFHKKAGTELEIIEPKREQLSGDDAHDRVEAMLSETLDTKLWEAQRVLQSSSTEAVKLSGSDSLARALDAAAGETDAGSSNDDSLWIDLIDAEYLKYFTPTGRPTGPWKAVTERVTAAEAEVRSRLRAVEEVDERVARHEALTAALQALDESLAPANSRLTAARTADDALTELRDQLSQARQIATTVAATSTSSALADTQRRQLVADCERRTETLVALQAQRAEAEQQETGARQAAASASTAAEQAGAALDGAQRRFDAARAAAEACVAREEADRLAARVASIDEIENQLAQLATELDAITLTDTMLTGIEEHFAAVQRIDAQLQADATTVAFTAPTDLDITVDGRARTLSAGQSWTQPASAAVVVEVPGVLSVRIDPGASAAKLIADRDAAQQRLDRELKAAGVLDAAAARALDAQRRALTESRTTHAAKLEGLCSGEDSGSLRARLAELRAVAPDGRDSDPEAVAAELTAARDALRDARTHAEKLHQVAADAASAQVEKSTAA